MNNIYDNCMCKDGIYCYKHDGNITLTNNDLNIIINSKIFSNISDRNYFSYKIDDVIEKNIIKYYLKKNLKIQKFKYKSKIILMI